MLNQNAEAFLAAGILAAALSPVFFFDKRPINGPAEGKLITHKVARPAAILTIVSSTLGAVVFLGVGRAVLNMNASLSGAAVLTWYYLGGIAGSFLYAFIFFLPRGSVHMALSLPFGCAAAGLLCNTYAAHSANMAVIFALLLGIGTSTGMSTVYYLLGVVGKKFNSMSYVRLSILVIGVGGVTGVIIGSGIGSLTDSAQISVTVTVASFAAVVMVLIFSPAIVRVCFADNWAGDMTLSEIQELREAVAQAVRLEEHTEKREDELLSS